MKKINRDFAKEFFQKELFCTINGFKGMKFDDAINPKAKFFYSDDMVFSYVEEENYIFDLLLCTISGKINFGEIDKHFSEIGKKAFVEFKNPRLLRVLIARYPNRVFKINNKEAILLFNKEDD